MTVEHTYRADCRLAQLPPLRGVNDVPPVEAQFFYSSASSIDDSNINTAAPENADRKYTRTPMRPFSPGDNNSLERAWRSIMSLDDYRRHEGIRNRTSLSPYPNNSAAEIRTKIISTLTETHIRSYIQGTGISKNTIKRQDSNSAFNTAELCCSQLLEDVIVELEQSLCSLVRAQEPSLDAEEIARDIAKQVTSQCSGVTRSANHPNSIGLLQTNEPTEPHNRRAEIGSLNASDVSAPMTATAVTTLLPATTDTDPIQLSDSPQDNPKSKDDELNETLDHSNDKDDYRGQPVSDIPVIDDGPDKNAKSKTKKSQSAPKTAVPLTNVANETQGSPTAAQAASDVLVTVGVSKLHFVKLPALHMKPIYWSPVNDAAVVIRATWFYKDTMQPVSPAVANQLESGYHEMRPWSQTWRDEVRCALDIGADGEEKLLHSLWPPNNSITNTANENLNVPGFFSGGYCSSHCSEGYAAAQGTFESPKLESPSNKSRPFSNYHVLFKDNTLAFLIKPSLKPSVYYGRRPLHGIMKGLNVGIPVIRGFNRASWDQIRAPKTSKKAPESTQDGESEATTSPTLCPGCKTENDRGQITDLILVAHGIGQKIAERIESYHFTHAINTFRRAINSDLKRPEVRNVMRDDQNGMMVLPLNWRMGISFEDDPQTPTGINNGSPGQIFGLKDIEPETIPAIRSMMSDIMFDIPFYMSQHKGRMIQSLIFEANRVYRLWCRNNPGFNRRGRVHIIAHSLGSVMAVDILSRQPTYVPRHIPEDSEPSTESFEFDTTNLFLAGSPAGFFMLLEKGSLLPRRGRAKIDANPVDVASKEVAGNAGQFGCLAVDNVYNILAKEDPIAYLLNGAVDSSFSSSLRMAFVPSATPSLMTAMGNAMRQIVPGMSPPPDPLAVEPQRPSTSRLPSQLELDVHNFTREELAEKRLFLLNDNGQIDWFLRSGGGPLEIQYLNMLSAHTSYWANVDLIRMICLEIGRKPGRTNTFPALRAAKITKRRS